MMAILALFQKFMRSTYEIKYYFLNISNNKTTMEIATTDYVMIGIIGLFHK